MSNITRPNCVFCGGNNINRKGKVSNGTKYRWLCKDCNKYFTTDIEEVTTSASNAPIIREVVQDTQEIQTENSASTNDKISVCPSCGASEYTRKGKYADGARKCRCKNCGSYFREEDNIIKISSSNTFFENNITTESIVESENKINEITVYINGNNTPVRLDGNWEEKLEKLRDSLGGEFTKISESEYKIGVARGTKG